MRIRFRPSPYEEALSCSFCSAPRHQVPWLVKGEGVLICESCMKLCQDIIKGDAVAPRASKYICSFCSRLSHAIRGCRASICFDCVELCVTSLEESRR